ncbi:GTPase Era [Sphingobacteriaceae bacterium AH-315-L07]|nr:GTPase Era [Sphingobacteriaceae bacterium AH-315-L07]
MSHKAGFVNIIGNPNVGKSTLLNALIGEKLSIITPKIQTTRHRILGILNEDDYQIVFSDTPGILKPNYKLQESMLDFVLSALQDADVILYVTDTIEQPDHADEEIFRKLNGITVPIILLINKIDIVKADDLKNLMDKWKDKLSFKDIVCISALRDQNIDVIKDQLIALMPEHEAYFDKEELSDRPTRFFISEIIREKLLMKYRQEIPYSVEVNVERYEERDKLTFIAATIYVSRESQRPIVIGKGGKAIKQLGISARKDIEKFIGNKIYLELSVKVKKDWRDDDNMLRQFGYST